MKLGIMQPYFVPYIGYWQRIQAVDKYVVYDDVNFIKSGWINRNRIMINGEIKYFNLPMLGSSPNKLINEVLLRDGSYLREKMLKTLEQSYKKAPYYTEAMAVLSPIIKNTETNIAIFLYNHIKLISEYLGLKTEFVVSSALKKDNSLRAQDKIIHICKLLGATEYYNALSGEHLYNKNDFAKENISLHFIEAKDICYKQFNDKFEPNLSIIDVMMFNSREKIAGFLAEYRLR